MPMNANLADHSLKQFERRPTASCAFLALCETAQAFGVKDLEED